MMKSREKRVCPFSNDPFGDMTLHDKIFFSIASVTIAPIRCILVIITMLLLWASATIVLIGRTKDDMIRKPLGKLRSFFKPIPVFLSRLLFFFAGFHWISVHGKEDKKAKVMAIAPHSSFMDAIGFIHMNYPSVLGRAGSNEVPFFGKILNLCQSIMVNRESQTSRAETVKKINERLNSPLNWPRLGIFVEGTCSNRKSLLEFKPGAFIPGLPIQPVCFKYTNRIDTTSWCWKGPSVWWILWLTLCQLHNGFEIHFLPVYTPNEDEKKNPILFANNVRDQMAKYLDINVTDHSFEDFLLSSKFEKRNIHYNIDQVNVNKVKRHLGISTDSIFELVPLYAQICDQNTGLCDFNSFERFLQIKSHRLINYFKIFTQNESFNFNQFLLTYFQVIERDLNSNQQETQQMIDNLIQHFDDKKDIYQNLDELLQIELLKENLHTPNEWKSYLKKQPLLCYFVLQSFSKKF